MIGFVIGVTVGTAAVVVVVIRAFRYMVRTHVACDVCGRGTSFLFMCVDLDKNEQPHMEFYCAPCREYYLEVGAAATPPWKP